MEDFILITELNDFIFCPVSIFFHKLYGNMDKMMYQSSDQINGTEAHKYIDEKTYTTSKDVLMSIDVFCEKYRLIGKIDTYDKKRKLLRERKKKIVNIYDGYVFQLYAQYFSLIEMGYEVDELQLYSIDDNKIYKVPLPSDNPEMLAKFEKTIDEMRNFDMEKYVQTNELKCNRCIYEPACDRTLLGEENA